MQNCRWSISKKKAANCHGKDALFLRAVSPPKLPLTRFLPQSDREFLAASTTKKKPQKVAAFAATATKWQPPPAPITHGGGMGVGDWVGYQKSMRLAKIWFFCHGFSTRSITSSTSTRTNVPPTERWGRWAGENLITFHSFVVCLGRGLARRNAKEQCYLGRELWYTKGLSQILSRWRCLNFFDINRGDTPIGRVIHFLKVTLPIFLSVKSEKLAHAKPPIWCLPFFYFYQNNVLAVLWLLIFVGFHLIPFRGIQELANSGMGV